MDKLLIFISYAHEDVEYKDAFRKEFPKLVLEKNNWDIWDDADIKAGAIWNDEIKNALDKAEVIVLLVSSDFLNSDFINNVELVHALEKQKQGVALVIPIILDKCDWKAYDVLPKIQAVNVEEKILDKGNKYQIKDALQYAAAEVRESIRTYKADSAKPASGAFKAEEINELRQLDPDALIIAVRQKQGLCLLMPKSGNPVQLPLASTGLPQKVVSILQRLLLKGDIEEDECRVLGEALFYRLFPEAAAQQTFIKTWKANTPTDGKPLKIVLHFDDQSNELAGLPWEYLWLPLPEGKEDGFFICEKENLVLTRRLSAAGKEKKVSADKLRILIAYSKPQIKEIAQRVEGDAQSVFSRSQPQKEEDKKLWVNIEVAGPQEFKSQKEFEAFIKKEKPFHIVHFISAGKSEKTIGADNLETEKNQIAFCDPAAKKEEWLAPDELIKCFPDDKKPNLIFLHPPPDSCRSLRNMALNLVTSLDGVLAIQTPVKSEEAADFSEKLYTALASGDTLDEAVTRATRYTAEKSTRRLRMYGISASFSRTALKMEVAKEAEAAPGGLSAMPQWKIWKYCPNVKKPHPTQPRSICEARIFLEGDQPASLFCESCGEGPLWLCPNCKDKDYLISLKSKVCPTCGTATATFKIPPEIRNLLNKQQADSDTARPPAVAPSRTPTRL